jgi:antirestriction protein ArdC
MIKGYPTPYYITYKQAQQLGGIIKKGEKGIRIIYWATVEMKNQSDDANAQPLADDTAKPRTRMVPKAYTVFNIAQTEDIEFPCFDAELRTETEIIEACENIITNIPNKLLYARTALTHTIYHPPIRLSYQA